MQGGWYNRGYGGAMAGALAGAKKPWASLSQGQQASRSAKFEQFKKKFQTTWTICFIFKH